MVKAKREVDFQRVLRSRLFESRNYLYVIGNPFGR